MQKHAVRSENLPRCCSSIDEKPVIGFSISAESQRLALLRAIVALPKAEIHVVCPERGRGRAWPRCRWAVAGPCRTTSRHVELPNSAPAPLIWRAPERPEGQAAVPVGGGGAWPGTPEPQAPPVWRAPEGPEGTGGLRGAAPSEARLPSLAGGRALRRLEHQRRHRECFT